MTQTGFPLAKSAIATPQQWSNIAQNWLGTGVIKGMLNELQVYADSTGMQIKVKSGQAYIKGHFFQSDAEEILPIGSADSGNPRIDRIIVRMDWVADSIQLAVLQGVAAVTPSAPALTQNTSRWEISLAQIAVGANVSTIAAGNVTDERNFVKNANTNQEAWKTATLQNGAYHVATGDDGGAAYWKDEWGEVHSRGTIVTPTAALGTVLWNFPVGYRPGRNEWITAYYGSGNVYDPILCAVTPAGDFKIFENGGVNGGTLRISEFEFRT